MEVKIGGLNPSSKEQEAKRYPLGAIRKEINVDDIAGKDFSVCDHKLTVRDQRADDDCTGHAIAVALEAHEGIPISPKWNFMRTKLKEGDLDSFGASLEDALSIPKDFGALPEADEPPEMKDAPRSVYADWTKWPNLENKAAPHEQKSYWWITQGSYPSIFDALRANIYQNLDKKDLIVTGTNWRSSWTFGQGSSPIRGIIAKDLPDNDPQSGHAFSFCGVKHIDGVPYLEAHLSNGLDFGNEGHFYFPQEVVEKVFTYGFAMYVDLSADVAAKVAVSDKSVTINLMLAFAWKTLFKINELLKQLVQIQGD